MDIDVRVEKLLEKISLAHRSIKLYEERILQLNQSAKMSFNSMDNEVNEGDFQFIFSMLNNLKSDLENNKELFGLILEKQIIYKNILDEISAINVGSALYQATQFDNDIEIQNGFIVSQEFFDKVNDELSRISHSYYGSYRQIIEEMQQLIEVRGYLQYDLQGINSDLEPIKETLNVFRLTGELPRDIVLYRRIQERADELLLSSHISALPPAESEIPVFRDNSLDAFLPNQLCHAKP